MKVLKLELKGGGKYKPNKTQKPFGSRTIRRSDVTKELNLWSADAMTGTMQITLVHQCIRRKAESNYIVNKVGNRNTARRQLLIQGKR